MAAIRLAVCAIAGAVLSAASAFARCSQAADPLDADVVILRCEGVVIAAEASAVRSPLELLSAHPRTLQLDAGAVAVSAQSPFTILTPAAVVSGREGAWAVVAGPGRTLAAVRRGTATMLLRMDGSERILQAGESEIGAADAERIAALDRALERSRNRQ